MHRQPIFELLLQNLKEVKQFEDDALVLCMNNINRKLSCIGESIGKF